MFFLAQAVDAAPQAAPVVDVIGTFYGTLLQNGLLGLALAFTVFLLLRRDKELQTSWQARLDDAKSLANVIKDHATALQASNAAAEERNHALDVAGRAAEKSATVIEQLSKEIETLQAEVRGYKNEVKNG